MNPQTSQLLLAWRPPGAVQKGVITDPARILFRVTAREKEALYPFTESDFLPDGTSPGVAGGTPAGKLAITLDASKLKGVVYDLKEGDHVVLQASIAVDMPGAGHSSGGRFGTNVVATPDMTLLPKRSLVRTLVEDGVVVTPARTRKMPISSSSLMGGTSTHTMPVQEIVLAVDPEEVAPLAEAMDLKYEITCMVRSGRPSPVPSPAAHSSTGGESQTGVSQVLAALTNAFLGSHSATDHGKAKLASSGTKNVDRAKAETPARSRVATKLTPGLDPMAQTRFMEVMVGSQRQFVLFTGPGKSPVVAMQDDGSARAGSGVVPAGAVEESKQ